MTTTATVTLKKVHIENFATFMDRMEMFFPHTLVVKGRVFYKLLKNEFRSKFRKAEIGPDGKAVRYFEHMRRVFLILIDEIGVVDFVTLMSAWGHDGFEDTDMWLEEVTLVCGEEVSKTIALCSKRPVQGFARRLRLLGTWRVLLVKFADRIDNLRTVGTDPEFVAKTVKETDEMYLPMCELLVERSPEEFKPQARAMVALLLETLAAVKARA